MKAVIVLAEPHKSAPLPAKCFPPGSSILEEAFNFTFTLSVCILYHMEQTSPPSTFTPELLKYASVAVQSALHGNSKKNACQKYHTNNFMEMKG